MDRKSLEILEFPQIKQILAGYTSFSVSRQMALDLTPTSDYKRIVHLLNQSTEARKLLASEIGFSLGKLHDIRSEVQMAARGKTLEPQNLLDIQQTLMVMSETRYKLERYADELPLIWNIASQLVNLENIAYHINHCLAPNGEILDNASDHLAELRQQIKDLRQKLSGILEGIIQSPRGQEFIQEAIITEREGRYVIPVKIERRREIKGIVHDISNTGATIFVEPWTTIETGNSLRETIAEEKREVERILQNLSSEVGVYETEITQSINLIAELDLLLAKAYFAKRYHAAEPALVVYDDIPTQSTVLKILEARHPLLGDNAVPLSIEIGRDFSILIITGPNTGGKTVALKTIGLLSLMTQAGIPIPASGDSQIPIFDNIFADIGDEQSIIQTLSTFGWHIGNINHIIREATPRSLVLLDELGTSTDPVEGSALAISILRHFLKAGTMTVATTHFSEVKALAHSTTGMQNASFDFDPVTLSPTFHLTLGIPSGSNALAVARHLGLPSEIIMDAEKMIPQGIRELEALLNNLKSKEQEIATLHRQLEKEKETIAQNKRVFEEELRASRIEMNSTILKARRKIESEVTELSRQVNEAATELKKEKSREKVEQTRKIIAEVREQMSKEIFQTEEGETGQIVNGNHISIGDTVSIRDMAIKAKVLSISEDRHEVELQAGHSRLCLSIDKIDKINNAKPLDTSAKPYIRIKERPLLSANRELNLRGKRADEIEPMLDHFLNEASLTGFNLELRIVHGYGTGTVRQITRDFLARHPLVKSFRPGNPNEGGDGATIVQL